MKVALVVASLDILGGHSVAAVEIVENFKKEGIALDIIPINPKLSGIWAFCQKIKYLRTIVTETAYIASLLRNVPKYDVLHIFSASYWSFLLAPAPAAVIGRFYGKKTVLNYHSGELEDHFRRHGRIIRAVLKCVDVVIVPSLYLQRVFAAHGVAAQVIYNTIDPRKFAFKRRDVFKPKILINRNFFAFSNNACAIRAFKAIQAEYPEAALTVIGAGPQDAMLRGLAARLEIQNVTFAGKVGRDSILERYNDADILLNSSGVGDNVPITILEAFGCGILVVSTAAGGIPDMISDGETGFLCDLDDDKSMARKAIALLGNQELARAIARNALEHCAKNYSWEAVRQKWLDVYSS